MKINQTKLYKIKVDNDTTYNIFIENKYKTNKINQNFYNDIIKKENNEYTNYMKKIYSIYSSQNLENSNFFIRNESNSDDSLIQETEDSSEIENRILILLSNSSVEWGMISDFDEFIIENIDNEYVLKSILKIFYDNYQNEDTIVKILNAIANVEYEKVKPYGQMMAIASFSHKSMAVQQKAIEAFENWKSEDSINALESVKFSEPWMQRYVDKIINNLKEEVVINA